MEYYYVNYWKLLIHNFFQNIIKNLKTLRSAKIILINAYNI